MRTNYRCATQNAEENALRDFISRTGIEVRYYKTTIKNPGHNAGGDGVLEKIKKPDGKMTTVK